MAYIIKMNETPQIDFFPASVIEEVIQNVRTIVTTIKYSIPLDREFGIDGAIVDLPINVAKAKLTNEIFRAIRRYEPRAVIESISFQGEETGRLIPTVEVSINA
ncbi:MAG: hypothetical protein IJ521_08425 [Schwartzia sp.]|nr:hypothetical protein [Schwartzia sp. (in: firmicutes)]